MTESPRRPARPSPPTPGSPSPATSWTRSPKRSSRSSSAVESARRRAPGEESRKSHREARAPRSSCSLTASRPSRDDRTSRRGQQRGRGLARGVGVAAAATVAAHLLAVLVRRDDQRAGKHHVLGAAAAARSRGTAGIAVVGGPVDRGELGPVVGHRTSGRRLGGPRFPALTSSTLGAAPTRSRTGACVACGSRLPGPGAAPPLAAFGGGDRRRGDRYVPRLIEMPRSSDRSTTATGQLFWATANASVSGPSSSPGKSPNGPGPMPIAAPPATPNVGPPSRAARSL